MRVDHDLGGPAGLRQGIPGRVVVVEDPYVLTLELDLTPMDPRSRAADRHPGIGGGHDEHAVKAEAAIAACVVSDIRLAPHSRQAPLRRRVELVAACVRSRRVPRTGAG